MFRQCRRVRTACKNTGISRFKSLLKHSRILRGQLSIHLHQSHKGDRSMSTKMILAAIALSLSLAACAKKEEPAEAAQDAAATASDAAGEAQDAAGQAQDAAGDAAAAAGDAATTPPAEQTTPPAGEQPAQPPQQ
jgi:hypothetical protein